MPVKSKLNARKKRAPESRKAKVVKQVKLRKSATGERPSKTPTAAIIAFKSFCRWLVRDGRASASPVEYLQGLNVRTDRRHDRRPLTVEEMIWLLDVTESGPPSGKVPGPERALLYRVAAETGLRAGELRSLTAGSFDLDAKPPTVKVLAGYSKHRTEDVGVMKRSTADLLAKHLAAKMPIAAALRMPGRRMLPVVLKKDLASARQQWLDSAPDAKTRTEMEKTDFLAYKDRDGRYADFHALRHMTGSYRARASVSPKVAQSILRHSDINLTMNFYSHAFREDRVHAVEGLPDLSARPARPKKDIAG